MMRIINLLFIICLIIITILGDVVVTAQQQQLQQKRISQTSKLIKTHHDLIYNAPTSLSLSSLLNHTTTTTTSNNAYFGSDSSQSISTQCESDLYDLSKLKYPNSFSIIEASGKGLFDLGNYDNCLSLPSNVSQYCAISTPEPGFIVALSALCVPSSCSEQDINLALQTLVNMSGMADMLSGLGYYGEFAVYCYSGDHTTVKEPMTAGPIIMIVICAIFATLVVLGTIIEYLLFTSRALAKKDEESYRINEEWNLLVDKHQVKDLYNPSSIFNYQEDIKESHIVIQVLLAFSLIQNYNSFANSSSEKKHFDVLDGVRFLSTCWVVMGHTILFNLNFGYDNALTMLTDATKTVAFQLITAGEFAVDTFFMLSGFLVGHSLIAQVEKPSYNDENKIKFWFKYLVHRFIRLSPLLYFVVFVFWKLSPQFGSGPFWFGYASVTASCDKYWWTNLIYINTLYPPTMGTECAPWTWYLGDDFLYYVFVAPIAILLYKKSPKFGFSFIGLLFAITFTTNFWITYKYDLGTFFEFTKEGATVTNFTTDIYQKPWTRVGAYGVGLAMSMLMQHPGFLRVIKNTFYIRSLYYIAALGITSFFTFISYNSYIGEGWTKVENAFFNGTGHTGFVIGLGLFLLTAFSGRGGLVAWILERPIFKNLSKLTYSTYLVHPIVLWTLAFSHVTLFHYSTITLAATIISTLVFSFAAAFLVHLGVEKPFTNLEKLIFHRPPTTKYTLLN